jgi:hypothetical protein
MQVVVYIITEISYIYPNKYEVFNVFRGAVEFSTALEFTFSSQQFSMFLKVRWNLVLHWNLLFQVSCGFHYMAFRVDGWNYVC